ncbi:6984_t:CDS:2, partial [Funneliformis geosporum]
PKKAANSPPAPSISSILTSFEIYDVSKIAIINKILTVISPSNNNNNNNMKVDNIFENSSSFKDRSKLLNPDEHLEDNNMEEGLKDFTIIIKATLFAITNSIKFTFKEKNNRKIILAINNIFTQNDDFKRISVCHINLTHSVIIYFIMSDVATAALYMTIPNFKIKKFLDFTQYKTDMQFNERIIHITDILLQIKPVNIKQVFVKYGTITNFRIIVRGM